MGDTEVVAPPTTPEGAHARLAELTGNAAWGAKLLAGDTAVKAEFTTLSTIIAGPEAAAPTAEQLAGRSERASNDANTREFIRSTRESVDVSDGVLAQIIGGEKVSKAEFDAAKAWKSRHFADEGWTKRLLAGDAEAKRDWFNCSVILSSNVKETQ